MISHTQYVAVTSASLVLYIVLVLLVPASPDLGFWWKVGLEIYFAIGIVISIQVLLRANKRQKALEDLALMEKYVGLSEFKESINYIRKYLK